EGQGIQRRNPRRPRALRPCLQRRVPAAGAHQPTACAAGLPGLAVCPAPPLLPAAAAARAGQVPEQLPAPRPAAAPPRARRPRRPEAAGSGGAGGRVRGVGTGSSGVPERGGGVGAGGSGGSDPAVLRAGVCRGCVLRGPGRGAARPWRGWALARARGPRRARGLARQGRGPPRRHRGPPRKGRGRARLRRAPRVPPQGGRGVLLLQRAGPSAVRPPPAGALRRGAALPAGAPAARRVPGRAPGRVPVARGRLRPAGRGRLAGARAPRAPVPPHAAERQGRGRHGGAGVVGGGERGVHAAARAHAAGGLRAGARGRGGPGGPARRGQARAQLVLREHGGPRVLGVLPRLPRGGHAAPRARGVPCHAQLGPGGSRRQLGSHAREVRRHRPLVRHTHADHRSAPASPRRTDDLRSFAGLDPPRQHQAVRQTHQHGAGAEDPGTRREGQQGALGG
ncbi:unnamed protein product, partial [Prorocentrum cordatum]